MRGHCIQNERDKLEEIRNEARARLRKRELGFLWADIWLSALTLSGSNPLKSIRQSEEPTWDVPERNLQRRRHCLAHYWVVDAERAPRRRSFMMGEKPRPDSAFVRFLLNTHHVRFFGKRVIRTYRSTTADGMRFMVHTRDGAERHLLQEIVDSHIYERFPMQKGDTVVDVGANIGCMTAVLAERVGASGRVHSFEPHPRLFRNYWRIFNFYAHRGFWPISSPGRWRSVSARGRCR